MLLSFFEKKKRYGTVLNFELYRRDYIILYVDTVRAIVQKEDTSRPFVVSSPSNGKESEEEGYIAKNPYDDLYGDSKFIHLEIINKLYSTSFTVESSAI